MVPGTWLNVWEGLQRIHRSGNEVVNGEMSHCIFFTDDDQAGDKVRVVRHSPFFFCYSRHLRSFPAAAATVTSLLPSPENSFPLLRSSVSIPKGYCVVCRYPNRRKHRCSTVVLPPPKCCYRRYAPPSGGCIHKSEQGLLRGCCCLAGNQENRCDNPQIFIL
ncbi:unnamed protein product [Lactuca virosa]|uniref:Uncharacterized protein n=1 Tax=Lactuca virosa TaxID=75947 RepID=A0AAU9M8M8_9ASTR|nr:unnamed protein product [Lactuca virosa]